MHSYVSILYNGRFFGGTNRGRRNKWRSKHLAFYETLTGNGISRPLQENYMPQRPAETVDHLNAIQREKQKAELPAIGHKRKCSRILRITQRTCRSDSDIFPTSYAYSKQFLTHLVTADVTVMPHNGPRDGEASCVRLHEVLSTTHTHSLRYGARPDATVTGMFKIAHLYGRNTFSLYFASHNKSYPEWHVSQNKFKM